MRFEAESFIQQHVPIFFISDPDAESVSQGRVVSVVCGDNASWSKLDEEHRGTRYHVSNVSSLSDILISLGSVQGIDGHSCLH